MRGATFATAATPRASRSKRPTASRSSSTSAPACATGATRFPQDGSFRGSALITHLHWDHVQGLPFFVPIDRPGARLDIYGPPQDDCTLEQAFEDFMRPPYFPVRFTDLRGDIRFHDVTDTDIAVGDAKVKVRSVPHVGLTNGYRIEMGGAVVAYISDHQQPMDGGMESPATYASCAKAPTSSSTTRSTRPPSSRRSGTGVTAPSSTRSRWRASAT